jgi:hypothetical protein
MNTRTETPRAGLLAAALVVSVAAAQAQTPPQRRPGLWEVSMPGGTKVNVCITPEGVKDFVGNVPPKGKASCDHKVLSSSATELRYRNVCPGPGGGAMTMEGHVYDVTPERMTSDVKMSMAGHEGGTVHTTARWLRPDCQAGK